MAINASLTIGRREVLELAAAGMALGTLGAAPVAAVAQTGIGAAGLKIATIGAGREGGALGTLFAKRGHPVMFSSRNPDQLNALVAGAGPNAQAGTVEQAVTFGDVVLLVVPYTAVEEIGKQHGKALAAKRLVLDVSNPIARRDGEEIVRWANEQGGAGLATAKLIPGARLVRGFNAIGSGRLAEDAGRKGDPVGIPIAGDDAAAVELASSLIRELGFEPVLVGGLAMGKYLVPGTPLAGEHSPAELRQIAQSLK
jgi:8-hydroxy-5-deazaflavin:NADPH oxidoreductase